MIYVSNTFSVAQKALFTEHNLDAGLRKHNYLFNYKVCHWPICSHCTLSLLLEVIRKLYRFLIFL